MARTQTRALLYHLSFSYTCWSRTAIFIQYPTKVPSHQGGMCTLLPNHWIAVSGLSCLPHQNSRILSSSHTSQERALIVCRPVCCRPFSVEPSAGTLNVGESMQLEVEFEPQTVGSHSKRLIVHYDTGMHYSLLKVLHVKKGQMENVVKRKRKWLFWLH